MSLTSFHEQINKPFRVKIIYNCFISDKDGFKKAGVAFATKRIPHEALIIEVSFERGKDSFYFAKGFNSCKEHDHIMPDEGKAHYFNRGWEFRWKLANMLLVNKEELPENAYAVVMGSDFESDQICSTLINEFRKKRAPRKKRGSK